MPAIQTISLPNYLPHPGDSLQKLFPPNHDLLGVVLGLTLAYLKHMHPSKLIHADESTKASAHILSLLIQDPLVQSLLPKSTPPNLPTQELKGLQVCLTTLENMLTNLAKATTEVRKEIKSKPPTPAPTPAKASPPKGSTPTQPTYAAKAASPQHPSIVVEASAYTWPDNTWPPPADICATINAALSHSSATQVRVSAIRWTPKGNLVLWGGGNTMASQLTNTIPHIYEALHPSLSAQAQSAPALPPTLCHNTKWLKLCLNSVPTGKSDQ